MFSIPAFAINNSYENGLGIPVLVNFPNLYYLFPCRTNPCFFSPQMMNVNPNLNDSNNQQNKNQVHEKNSFQDMKNGLIEKVPDSKSSTTDVQNDVVLNEDKNDNDDDYQINNSESDKNHPKKLYRVHFTKTEDERIMELVERFGKKNWALISSFMNGRTAKQCRDRYCNYLIPGFFQGEWSKEEDELLLKLYKENGSKWSVIKNHFPKRSSNSLKNRWYYFLRKEIKSMSEKNNDEVEEEKNKNENEKAEKNFLPNYEENSNENNLLIENENKDDKNESIDNDFKINDVIESININEWMMF